MLQRKKSSGAAQFSDLKLQLEPLSGLLRRYPLSLKSGAVKWDEKRVSWEDVLANLEGLPLLSSGEVLLNSVEKKSVGSEDFERVEMTLQQIFSALAKLRLNSSEALNCEVNLDLSDATKTRLRLSGELAPELYLNGARIDRLALDMVYAKSAVQLKELVMQRHAKQAKISAFFRPGDQSFSMKMESGLPYRYLARFMPDALRERLAAEPLTVDGAFDLLLNCEAGPVQAWYKRLKGRLFFLATLGYARRGWIRELYVFKAMKRLF